MNEIPKEVRTSFRSAAEMEDERNSQRRSAGVDAFIEATNALGDGSVGYQVMLKGLFKIFEANHGAEATIVIVLEALKPVFRHSQDLAKVAKQLDKIIDEINVSSCPPPL